MLSGTLPTTAKLIVISQKKALKNQNKIKTKKKRTSIGVKRLVQLIADNVYQATFKKSLKNEK